MGAFDDIFTDKPKTTGAFDDLFGGPPERTLGGTLKDVGVTAVKGLIGVPEALTGLADIPTGGRAGKFMEEAGVDFERAQTGLDTLYSPAQKAAQQKVTDADGFVGKTVAAVTNPSTIAVAVGESLPLMLTGGVAGRLLGSVAKLAPTSVIPAAFGEGIMAAGSSAEGIRQQSEDGLLTGKQSAVAGASGALTGLFGFLGGKVAQKLGIADVDIAAAGGDVLAAATQKGITRRAIEGAFTEGVLEELPQSVQEQMLNNIALDKDVWDGVDEAAAMGMLAGAAMGGPFAAISPGKPAETAPEVAVPPQDVPPQGTSPAPPPPPKDEIDQRIDAIDRQTQAQTGQVADPDLQANVEAMLAEARRGPVEPTTPVAEAVSPSPVQNEPAAQAEVVDLDRKIANLEALPEAARTDAAQANLERLTQERQALLTTLKERNNDLPPVQQPRSEAGQEVQGVRPQRAVAVQNGAEIQAVGEPVANEASLVESTAPTTPLPQGIPDTSEGRSSVASAPPGANPQAAAVASLTAPVTKGRGKNAVTAPNGTAFTITDPNFPGRDKYVFAEDAKGNLSIVKPDGTVQKASEGIANRVFLAKKQGMTAPYVAPQADTTASQPQAPAAVVSAPASPVVSQEQPAVSGKQPWQMTPSEYVAGITDRDEIAIRKAAHPQQVKAAIASGEAVPAPVLEAYKANQWAKVALGQPTAPSAAPSFTTYTPQPGDVAAKSGPFKTQKQAQNRRTAGLVKTHDVVAVAGGYVLRPNTETATIAAVQNDPRLKRKAYRGLISDFVAGNTQVSGSRKDGGEFVGQQIRNEADEVVGRVPSPNMKALQPAIELAGGVQPLRTAVDKAAKGVKLGIAQARAVKLVLDAMTDQRRQIDNSDRRNVLSLVRAEAGRTRQIANDAPELTDADFADVTREDYPEEWDAETRTMADLAEAADKLLGKDAVDAILDSAKSDGQIAVDLYAAIAKGKADGRESKSGAGVAQKAARDEEAGQEVTPRTEKTPDGEQTKAFATPPTFGKTSRDQQPGVGKNGLDFTRKAPEADLFAETGNVIAPPAAQYPDTYFKTVRSPGNGPDQTMLTDDGRVAAYAEAAKSIWPGLTLGKLEVDAVELVHSVGAQGLAPKDIKRGMGDTFFRLSSTRKDSNSTEQELAAVMSGDVERYAELQETNAIIRNVQDEETYQEAYRLTRIGAQLFEAAHVEMDKMVASRQPRRVKEPAQKPAPPAPKPKTLIKAWNGEVRKVGNVFEVELKDGTTTPYPTEQEARKALFVAGAGKAATDDVVAPAAEKPVDDKFGEVLGGGRRRDMPSLSQELTDDQIANQPLSKTWPKDEIDTIEDTYLAAFATAARAEIPAKPKVDYKLKRWTAQVKALRSLTSHALRLGQDDFKAKVAQYSVEHRRALDGFQAKVRLLEKLPREQWGRIGKVSEHPDAYRYVEGEKRPSPFVQVEIDGRTVQFPAETAVEGVAGKVSERLSGEVAEQRMKFEVRGPQLGPFSINKKGDPLRRKLKTFDDAQEALAFVRSNYDALATAWEEVKAGENVKETDTRSNENRPRVGADHRQGKDVSADQFLTTFGFRGGEFGKWVSQGSNRAERQGMLNSAYDALMDLSEILGVPPKALSLNGTLGLAFGSRGTGWASAHYEPGTLVINLTKTRGAGALAHELFHAFDHYFQRQRGPSGFPNRELNFITYSPETYYQNSDGKTRLPIKRFEELKAKNRIRNVSDWSLVEGVRPEVSEAFAELVRVLDASPMADRSKLIDKGQSGGYWSRKIEIAARAFENYVIAKMSQKGYHNDYLANVVDAERWGKDPSRYPYMLADELPPVEAAFDTLFTTIETKETDAGVAMYQRQPFYSAVERMVQDAKQDRWGSAQELVKWLTGKVSAAEIEALDLASLEGKPTKQAVLGHIKANTTEFEDVVLGGNRVAEIQAEIDLLGERQRKMTRSDRSPSEYIAEWEVIDAQRKELFDKLRAASAEEKQPSFATYTLPGAVEGSYREMFVTAPAVKSFVDDETARRVGAAKGWETDGWQDGHSQYASIANPVVRVRYNIREADGRKVLFIEEIQPPTKGEFPKMPKWLRDRAYQIGVKRIIALAKEQGLDGVSWTTAEQQNERWGTERIDWKKNADGTFTVSMQEQEGGNAGGINIEEEARRRGELLEERGATVATKEEMLALVRRNIREGVAENITDKVWQQMQDTSEGTFKPRYEFFRAIYGDAKGPQNLSTLFSKYGKEKVGTVALKVTDKEYDEWAAQHRRMYPGQTNEEMLDAYDTYSRAWQQPFLPITSNTPGEFGKFKRQDGRQGIAIADLEAAFNPADYKGLKGKITFVQTEEELPFSLQRAIERDGVSGILAGVYYDGQTYLVGDNIATLREGQLAILHESRHFGLDRIFGSLAEKRRFMALVAIAKPKEINAWLKQYATAGRDGGYTQAQRLEAAEEWLVDAVGRNEGGGIIDKFLAKVAQWVRSIFPNLELADAEIRSLVADVDKLITEGKSGARYVVGDTRYDGGEEGAQYLRPFGGIGPAPSALANASPRVKTAIDSLRMKFQDKFIPLTRVQEKLQAAGWVKNNANDAYRAEELFHGKATKRLEDFYASNVQPLLDAIKDSSVSIAELEDYLYAKFAPQRNAYIASINPKLPEGGSGMTDAEARQILDAFATAGKTADLERLARQVRAITALQRQIIRDEGLELDETMDAWEATNPDYVPLKGGHEEQGKGIGTGFNVKRSGTKRALGRTSKAENILAELFAQTGATIVRAEKAVVGRAFLKMVEENPGEQWTVYDRIPTTKGTAANPAIRRLKKEIATLQEMVAAPQYLADRVALQRLLAQKQVELANAPAETVQDLPDHRFAQGDNVLTVTLDDGTVKYIELEDSDLARVMKNLTPNQYGAVTNVLAKTLRYLSMMSTSLNPEFMVTNFTRDIQTAMVNLSGEQSAKIAKDVLKGVPSAMKGLHNALRGDKTHAMAQWFARYQKAGAQVSFMDLRGMEAWQRKLEALGKEGKYGMEQARKLGMIISDYNGIIENAARLSAFKVAIEAGMSESDAASLAKNLTVNFNRKGELGPAINALYMFANAGIQGSARILGALKHKNVRRIAGGTMVLAFLLAEANRLSGGDDDDDESKWDKISDFTKQTNFIFLRENGEMVKVRLPYGYNVFVAAGYALNDYMHNLTGKGGRDTLETAKFMASSVMNAFNPFGGDENFLKILAPTLADPLLEIATNENFMGDKIRPENLPFGAQKPDSELYFRSVSGASRAVTRTLNEWTREGEGDAGFIDISPETIDHLFGFALGGLGRSVGRLADVPGKALSGDLSVKDVPFLRQVYQQPTPYVDLDRFYTNVQKIEAARANLKQMEGPARKDFMARHPEIQLRVAAESHKKRMGALRKRFYAARDAGRGEEARQFEKQMQQMALRFNKIYNARTQ